MPNKEIIIDGELPPEVNEIGLNRLIRLALAVGVGSEMNFYLTEIQTYADPFEAESAESGLPRNLVRKAARLSILLSQIVQVCTDLEEEANEYLEKLGVSYRGVD